MWYSSFCVDNDICNAWKYNQIFQWVGLQHLIWIDFSLRVDIFWHRVFQNKIWNEPQKSIKNRFFSTFIILNWTDSLWKFSFEKNQFLVTFWTSMSTSIKMPWYIYSLRNSTWIKYWNNSYRKIFNYFESCKCYFWNENWIFLKLCDLGTVCYTKDSQTVNV